MFKFRHLNNKAQKKLIKEVKRKLEKLYREEAKKLGLSFEDLMVEKYQVLPSWLTYENIKKDGRNVKVYYSEYRYEDDLEENGEEGAWIFHAEEFIERQTIEVLEKYLKVYCVLKSN